MDDTIDNTRCTIWRVGKGNDTINGLKYNLCEGYYALNGIRVIAWLNFNSYVRTQSCVDIKLYLLFNSPYDYGSKSFALNATFR